MPAIDDHLASVAPEQRAALERIRAVVADAVPDAEQGRSYTVVREMVALRLGELS